MEKIPIIDSIRNAYTVNVDDEPDELPGVINLMNFANFQLRISSYKLEQKMEDLNKCIKEGKIKDTKLIEEYTKLLNEMKITIDDIFKKMKEDRDASEEILYDKELGYEYNNIIPQDVESYKKLANSIIKENVEKLIKYEKIIILYSEKFIDINKQINSNF